MPTTSMEDYLVALYQLQDANNGRRVQTSGVAEHLEVTPPTATSMFSRLAAADLVAYEKYNGALLTEDGERIALRILRNRRLLETYLTNELGYRSSEACEEVDRLEHHISDRLASRLADALDEPTLDTDETANLSPPFESFYGRGDRLTAVEEGTRVVVQAVVATDDETLETLSARRLTPGSSVTVVETTPFGIVTVRHRGIDEQFPLPRDVARLVRVTEA